MKKKFLFGIAAGLFSVATMVSFNVSSANGASDVSLDDIAVMAQAQDGEDPCPMDSTKQGTNTEIKDPATGTYTWDCIGSGSC